MLTSQIVLVMKLCRLVNRRRAEPIKKGAWRLEKKCGDIFPRASPQAGEVHSFVLGDLDLWPRSLFSV